MGALGLLTRVVRTIAGVIAGILGIGILLVVLEANEDNGIVAAVLDAARFFAGPFDRIFLVEDQRGEIAVNWGIAAVAYLIAGALIVALIAALGRAISGRRTSSPSKGRAEDPRDAA